MKSIKKIGILLLVCILLLSTFTLSVCAESEVDTSEQATTDTVEAELDKVLGSDLSMADRISYALQGTVTGLLMVFAVLALLALIVSLSKVVFYDIPKKRSEKEAAKQQRSKTANAQTTEPKAERDEPVAVTSPARNDDGELIAVITAAIAAAIDSGEYGDEFAGGFRVVSFKRTNTTAWNKR